MMMVLAVISGWAQPNGTGNYYQKADGYKGKSLKTALYEIIKSPSVKGYGELFECYKTTDLRPDGKIWDMYSNSTNFDPDNDHSGNYTAEGDLFNREHSFPKNWFGDISPMNSDLFHVIPTDGYVNNRRSNYPFGETNGERYKSNGGFSKVGLSTTKGYSGVVFEPNDEYKGDFARIYFYMVTCYESRVASWSCDMLAGNDYPAYKQWAIDMLLRWAKNDPVSQKEIDRNNAVFGIQGNRNPYVDYPGLEQYVWGSMTDVAFSYDEYEPGKDTDPDQEDGSLTYVKVTDNDGLKSGGQYLLVYEKGDESKALADMISSGKAYSYADVAVSGGQVTTEVNADGLPHELTIDGTDGCFTIFDTRLNAYLSLPSSGNALKTASAATGASEQWTISVSNGNAEIRNNKYTTRTIRYNAGSPRFACYTTGQEPVSLYKRYVSSSIDVVDAGEKRRSEAIYSIDGRRIGTVSNESDSTVGLPKGVYIIGGKKLMVK